MFLRTRYSLAAVATALILSGCSATPAPAPSTEAAAEPSIEASTSSPSSPAVAAPGANLTDAVAGCGIDGTDGVDLDAAGKSLTIDTKGPRETSGAEMKDVSCVLKALEVPKLITSKMKLSTSSAEETSASWAGRDYAWSYTPETHFKITIQA